MMALRIRTIESFQTKGYNIPPADEVHVWWATLDPPATDISPLASPLSDMEKKRARRFIHPHHRRRFIVSHGMLRIILGDYLNTPPEKIRFEYNSYGKPYIAGSTGPPPLCFNLSHSGWIALCGICVNRTIGVDVERIRPVRGMESIVRRYFAEKESGRILATPPPGQKKMFFQYWSMKEACLKAMGYGLTGLQKVAAPPVNDAFPAGHDAVYIDDKQNTWSIRSLPVVEGYAAAVALEKDAPWKVLCRQWRP